MDLSNAPASPLDAQIHPGKPTLERLLDTAAALFWEKGYAATTTREIAAAVGIQQASLYYHVASKEDLLYQLCVSTVEELLIQVQSAVNEVARPLERAKVLIRAHVTVLLKHQNRHVTMLTELRALSDRHYGDVLALRKRYASLVRSVLEEAQAANVIRTDIPANCLYLALLNVLNWAVLWFRRDQELSPEQLAELFTVIYLNGAAAPSERARLVFPEPRRSPTKSATRARGLSKASRKSTSIRLLDTAAASFSKKGYAATTTREIASLLGIQKASLYYHIETKEDLLYAICKSSLDQIRTDVATALAEVQDPVERTSRLIRTHIESLCRDQNTHSAARAEMHSLSEERLAHVMSLRDVYEDLVRSVLQEAQSAGALRRDIPVKYLCLSLLGLMNRVEVWFRPSGALSPRQLGEVFAMIFLTGAASVPSA